MRHHVIANIAVVGALVLGCASAPKPAGPGWLTDCRAFWTTPGDPVLCGVGAAGYSRDHRLLDRSAKQRARDKIGETLRRALMPVLKSEGGATTRHAESTLVSIVHSSLKASEIVSTWETDLPSLYALAAVKVEAVRDSIDSVKLLSSSVRQKLASAVEPSGGTRGR